MGNKKEDGKWERVRETAAASLCVGRHQPRIVDEEVCVDQSEINVVDQLRAGAEVREPSVDVLVGHLGLPVLEHAVADVDDHVPGGQTNKSQPILAGLCRVVQCPTCIGRESSYVCPGRT